MIYRVAVTSLGSLYFCVMICTLAASFTKPRRVRCGYCLLAYFHLLCVVALRTTLVFLPNPGCGADVRLSDVSDQDGARHEPEALWVHTSGKKRHPTAMNFTASRSGFPSSSVAQLMQRLLDVTSSHSKASPATSRATDAPAHATPSFACSPPAWQCRNRLVWGGGGEMADLDEQRAEKEETGLGDQGRPCAALRRLSRRKPTSGPATPLAGPISAPGPATPQQPPIANTATASFHDTAAKCAAARSGKDAFLANRLGPFCLWLIAQAAR